MSAAHSYKKPHQKLRRVDQISSVVSSSSPSSSSAPPSRVGTALEAIRLVKQAITYLNTHGKEQVLQAINTPGGPFRLHDLYVTVLDMNGNGLAHGADPKLAGRNALEESDVEGKTFIRERIVIAKSQGFGWQRYRYRNPAKGNVIESKAMYVQRVGEWIFACGIYTE